jgi:hypothetical protein
MNETFVVDGTNVCHWYSQSHPKETSIHPLLSILISILEHQDSFYCVFDANMTHIFEDQGKKNEANIVESLLENNKNSFFRVTGSTRADGVILHNADFNNRRIITNDIYRDHRNQYEWLSDKHTGRLIQGNLHDGLMTLDKLSYGRIQVDYSDLQASIERLNSPHKPHDPAEQCKPHDPSKPHMSRDSAEPHKPHDPAEPCKPHDPSEPHMSRDSAEPHQSNIRNNKSKKQEREEASKLKLNKEKACILRAQSALSLFLEPYHTYIPFQGSTWKNAVKGLKIFLDKNWICTHCYHICPTNERFALKDLEILCSQCRKGQFTHHPAQILKIIILHSPENLLLRVLKNIWNLRYDG